jgi:ribosomal protein S18 acetylase RimI-like enzyme
MPQRRTLRRVAHAAVIRELGTDDLSAAIGVVARGMRDNPLNIAAFGNDVGTRLEQLQRMFAIALPMVLRKGVMLGAFDGETLVGVAAMVPPGRCQPSASEKIALLPRMMFGIGFGGIVRIARWQGEWGKHDWPEPHWHVGPVAVDAHLQGQGIGRALMSESCTRIDRAGHAGYLETDKRQNVEFYKRFGFETIGEAPVLNTPNWFMGRRQA